MKRPRLPLSRLSTAEKQQYAIWWAEGRGISIPKKPGAGLIVAGLLGLLFGVVPGLLCLYFAWKQRDSYRRELNSLILRWSEGWERARRREAQELRLRSGPEEFYDEESGYEF